MLLFEPIPERGGARPSPPPGYRCSDAAAIGLPHDLKGHAIHRFVILRQVYAGKTTLEDELKAHVVSELGPIARPEKINFVASLPKTRPEKILRRLLRANALGQDVGDLSTLEP